MTFDEAESAPIPDPHTPKTFGVLNIVFALLLMPCSMCMTFYALVPALLGFVSENQAQQANQRDLQNKAELSRLDEDLKTATTDEQRQEIQVKRAAIESSPRRGPDFPKIFSNEGFRKPAYMAHFVGDLSSGLFLNLLMLISGAGLVYLKGWGRVLAIVVSWLKMVRLLILAISATFLIAPWLSNLVKFLEQEAIKLDPALAASAPNAGPKAALLVTIAGWLIFTFGSLYPIAQIRFLRLPSVREACRGRRPGWK